MTTTLHISGAGPAGLAAAITAARAGASVVAHEQRTDVGGRFHDDFQGLENWTTEADAIAIGYGSDAARPEARARAA